MGFYKDNTVEVKFNGKSLRVGKQVAEVLKANFKLDGQVKPKDKKTVRVRKQVAKVLKAKDKLDGQVNPKDKKTDK